MTTTPRAIHAYGQRYVLAGKYVDEQRLIVTREVSASVQEKLRDYTDTHEVTVPRKTQVVFHAALVGHVPPFMVMRVPTDELRWMVGNLTQLPDDALAPVTPSKQFRKGQTLTIARDVAQAPIYPPSGPLSRGTVRRGVKVVFVRTDAKRGHRVRIDEGAPDWQPGQEFYAQDDEVRG